MNRFLSATALCLGLVATSEVRALQTSSSPSGQDNCVIVTTSSSKSGETKTHSNSFKFKTKKECMKMKNIVSENFWPQTVKSVSSTVKWTGKEVMSKKNSKKKKKKSKAAVAARLYELADFPTVGAPNDFVVAGHVKSSRTVISTDLD